MDIYDFKLIQFFKDLSNFRKFKRDMKREDRRYGSKFARLNLHRNWFGNMVYTQINCTEADLANIDYDGNPDKMLAMKLKPYVEYLGTELGWSDYLVPTISNFVDENNDPTLSYMVMFVFSGYTMTLSKLLWFYVINTVLAVGGIWAMFHFLF